MNIHPFTAKAKKIALTRTKFFHLSWKPPLGKLPLLKLTFYVNTSPKHTLLQRGRGSLEWDMYMKGVCMNMSKHIAVLATDMVEEIELTDPVQAYKDAGHTVDIISNEANKTITGKNGDKIQADKGIDEVNAADYDALLVPGGFSPDLLRIDPKNSAFAKRFFQDDKPVFTICHGPQFLINTDELKGRTLTSFVSVRKDLENAGADVKDEEVVIDRNLVTSRTPDDLPAFKRETLKLLEK